MISIRKFLNPSLKVATNLFSDIFEPVNKRDGFIKGASPIIPIYFYRYIGIEENQEEYYDELKKLDGELKKIDKLYLQFNERVTLKGNNELTQRMQNMWQNNNFNSLEDVKIEKLIKLLKVYSIIPHVNDELINSTIEESFGFILDLYIKTEDNVNITKLKNFTLKILTWINDYAIELMKNFDTNFSDEIVNPKVVYYGNIKKHEVLFLICLSRLGCDVIYVNSPLDGDFNLVDKEEKYSKVIRLEKSNDLDMNKLVKNCETNLNSNKVLNINDNINNRISSNANSNTNININSKANNTNNISNSNIYSNLQFNNNNSGNNKILNQEFKREEYGQAMKNTLKESSDIFKDFTSSLNLRGGFFGKPIPVIPIYFYRYIGISENQDEYYNDLYRLDKKLNTLGELYLKFTTDLSIENNRDVITKTNPVWNNFKAFNKTQKGTLMNELVKSGVFPDLREQVINDSIISSFYDVLGLYLENETSINTAKVKNFCLKVIMWIHKYVPNLFKKFDYLKNSTGEILNPKVLYYGDMKKHEAYFFIFLSKMGCDILYVNSYGDEVFEEIDKNNDCTKLLKLPQLEALKDFPKEEVIIRQETTAFKASREIGSVIYNEEDGLYRPWQFEEYNIYPVTLKTTYDELKILWKEEARMRPGFKIENKTVYIPNLFAKVSGVSSDIKEYWKEFSHFKNEENLFFIPDIPYLKDTYSKYDLYSLEYCFNNEKLIDKEKLFEHRLYKFSYLKTALQNTIVDKINQLFKLPMFKCEMTAEFRLKVLMTVINIDENILELIQKFDYPFKIPKLFIYDNDKDIFSDGDAIVISFLNLMGFDIVVFTPTGYNNIEEKVDDKYYDIHKLESIEFDLQIPISLKSIRRGKQGSFWSNIFK